MIESKVDYHLHTYYSDGSMSPTDIVKRANELEYMEIAITDHDGIDGVKEAQIAGKALGINVISGIELSAEYVNEEISQEPLSLHILGYRIDIKNKELLKELEDIREKRKARNDKLLEVLSNMGYKLSIDDLSFEEESDYIGKPVIARALLNKGYISYAREAFEDGKFLESPEAKGVKKDKISAEKAINLIKVAGGTPVLAHPAKIKRLGERGSEQFYDNLSKLLRALKIMGLKGIECYHTDHTEQEELKLVELAEKYHLHITRGSDYHGPEFEKK
ncbi:MAG: PHP domain-containing protein [Aminipila sp.]